MYWVFQDNIFNEPWFDEMIAFLKRMDIPYEIVKAVPFTGQMIPEPTPTQDKVIFIGSYSFTNRAIEMGYTPGSWTNENYDYRVWSEKWPILNRGRVYKMKDVPRQIGPFFCRPCADDKAFTGQVFYWDEFEEWRTKIWTVYQDYDSGALTTMGPDTWVVVAPAKKIEEEYRFIVVGGKAITASQYGKGMYRNIDNAEPELWEFVVKCVDPMSIHHWLPSEVFALDIAIHDGKPYVLEMGNMNSAGLYKCDPQKIVMAIERL